jgi:hypothetical protein
LDSKRDSEKAPEEALERASGSASDGVPAAQPQKVRLNLSARAARYAQRDAPLETRLMAARGALPLPATELAAVLFALMHDPDAEVKSTARDSLDNLPDDVTNSVLTGDSNPAVLAYFFHRFEDNEGALEKIALNTATSDATIALLATSPHKKIIDIISGNQQRMLRDHDIVDALGSNPLTGRAELERILSFIDGPADLDDGTDPSAPISDEDAEAALRAVLGESMGQFAAEFVAESDSGSDSGSDSRSDTHSNDEEADSGGGIYQLVQKMSVFQKIQLARLGNKEARSLLVRDRNKLVSLSVVMSPKITESEIITIAQSRNVTDEVLRVISRGRDWTKNYQVKLALATNPKCPLPVAMQFVNYLQDKDLRTLVRSRDVPQGISTHARRILMKKGKI